MIIIIIIIIIIILSAGPSCSDGYVSIKSKMTKVMASVHD